jgi:hypothetical protein
MQSPSPFRRAGPMTRYSRTLPTLERQLRSDTYCAPCDRETDADRVGRPITAGCPLANISSRTVDCRVVPIVVSSAWTGKPVPLQVAHPISTAPSPSFLNAFLALKSGHPDEDLYRGGMRRLLRQRGFVHGFICSLRFVSRLTLDCSGFVSRFLIRF